MIHSDKAKRPEDTEGLVISLLPEVVREKSLAEGRDILSKDIAEETGLNKNTISRWMSVEPLDNINSRTILKLCRWANMPIEKLVRVEWYSDEPDAGV